MEEVKGLTDYEMKLYLERTGYTFYFPKIDNIIHNEELQAFAEHNGFKWDEKIGLWTKV